MAEKITVSAKTLDEAITKALIELQTTSEHLDYEIVQKESAGMLGIFGVKPCIIRAKVMTEQEENEKKAAAEKKVQEEKAQAEKIKAEKIQAEKKAQEEKIAAEKKAVAEKKTAAVKTEEKVHVEKEQTPVVEKVVKAAKYDEEKVKKVAEDFLGQVFGAMGMEVKVETSFDTPDREMLITLTGDDMGILIGKRGQTLDSLQYLVSLVVNKETEGYLRVKLDTENYRERRKEILENLARNISYKVKRTKKSVSLEPMNPYERRIIHSALQNDKYVVTRSEGEDPFRHVVIALKREKTR